MNATPAAEATGVPAADVNVPLCVDLDGSLIRTDVLFESALALLARNPLYGFAMLGWLWRGNAWLKQQIALRVKLPVASLPYNAELLDWLRQQARGRTLVLCTAADSSLAQAVADHVQLFDEVLASDGTTNLEGHHKADALIARFGDRRFDYVGNERMDLHVWRHARQAVVVSASPVLQSAVAEASTVTKVFTPPGKSLKTWTQALRVHQWLKNLLLFVPLLAAHRLLDGPALINATLAFVSFCLCASGVYLLNDLLDLHADRIHPRKRQRPFAAGTLPLTAGLVAAPLLTIAAFALAYAVAPLFALVLLGYYALTLGYSFGLKRVVMLDVIVLAALYTLRIIGGGAATAIQLSFWLLTFAMFVFLSLAMLKRYTELVDVPNDGAVRGRGYDSGDLVLVQSLGTASGYLSVLVLALYINSTASQMLYAHPLVLWLLCPLLLFWVSRAWMIAHRGKMRDDPVEFAARDRVSQVLLVLAALTVIAAS